MRKWSMEKLSKILKNKDVYLTFDLDGFDSSLMHATGTPEPGGLFWPDAMRILKTVFKNSNVVGADVNELAPNPHLHACDFLAAKLVYKILSYKFAIWELTQVILIIAPELFFLFWNITFELHLSSKLFDINTPKPIPFSFLLTFSDFK